MIIVDNALQAREAAGQADPRRAWSAPASWARASPTRSSNSVPGMRMAAIYNRQPGAGRRMSTTTPASTTSPIAAAQAELDDGDPRTARRSSPRTRSLICRSEQIDVLVDVTGSVEFGAHVILEAFQHGKSVVLMNAEVDATIGPILQVYAAKHGVILSACDGDEPGLQMNLYRWVKGLGLIPRVDRQRQGSAGSLSQSDHAAGLGRALGPEPGDGHVVRRRLEDQLRADDRRQRHRLQGPVARHVARR